jgi:hypothetical protein
VRHALASLVAISWLGGASAPTAGRQAPPLPPADQTGPSSEAGFRYPTLELLGQLKDIFAVGKCEYISGMTCKIKYTGSHPLPSRVYFVEFDEAGKLAGAEVRLLYPRLEPGETGAATFSTRLSSPTKVRLRGEWKGPWQNPY